MPTITIDNITRRVGRDTELIKVNGTLTLVGRRSGYPAGSFQLNRIVGLMFSPRSERRAIYGSIGSANNKGNTVNLRTSVLGTTGTRAVSGIGAIGSVPVSGTVVAYYAAWGD